MAGLAAAGAAKSMGAIVRGFDTRYKVGNASNRRLINDGQSFADRLAAS